MKLHRFAVAAALFLSGVSALLFQTLWLRLSGLVFGNAVWSAALILSSFMAGLALGSAIAMRMRRLPIAPLRLYAGLELMVAVTGCAIVFSLPRLGVALGPVFHSLWQHQSVLNALRLALSFALFVIPTTAMGLSLPVVLEDAGLRGQRFGFVVAVLYGCNTLGAVVGALAGEACLVGALGLLGTSAIAGALNVLAAVVALVIAGRSPSLDSFAVPAPNHRDAGNADRVAAATRGPRAATWRLLVISAGSGAVLLGLEVIWFRFLRLYVASSATVFATMLAIVLAGMAAGSLTLATLEGRQRRPKVSVLLLAGAVVTLISYVAFPVPALRGSPPGFYVDTLGRIAVLALELMFPAAFVSGMVFPTLLAEIEARGDSRMNSAGVMTLCNTIGATIGPLVATFLLLPRMGFQGALVFAAITYAALAAFATAWADWSPRRRVGRMTWSGVLGFAAILALFPYSQAARHLANARYVYEQDGSRLVRKIDGTADTLQLLRRDLYGAPYTYRLVTNGYSMSGTQIRSQAYMRLFAYLPLIFRPESRDALLICYGVGMTADALTRAPQLHRIDVVDISREVFDLAGDYTGSLYGDPLRDPRVHTYVQDGRFFLQANSQKYDLITGEPPPLKVSGTVNLYTQEFFAQLRQRLKPGGIATFWLPIYQLRVTEVKAILAGFHHAFPESSLWGGADDEWIMVGFNGPPRPLATADLVRSWQIPGMRDDLRRIGLEVPEQMGGLFIADADDLTRLTCGVPPLTDLYPKRLSDLPPVSADTDKFARPLLEARAAYARFTASPLIAALWPHELRQAVEPFFIDREIRYVAAVDGRNWLANLDLYLRQSRLRTPVLELLNSDELRVALAERAERSAPALREKVQPDLVAGALASRNFPAAIARLEQERARGFSNLNDGYLLVYLYCLTGQPAKGEALAAVLQNSIPQDWFTKWLWKKLESDFGFHPPT